MGEILSNSSVRWLSAAMALAVASSTQAATWTFSGATGGAWSDPANWQDVNLANGLPASGDIIALGGKTVNIDNYAAVMGQFNASGVVNINDGGSLTGSNAYTVRYITTINVNDGGTFNMNAAWSLRTDVNVNAGGVASGGLGIPSAESKRLTVRGVWSPRGTTLASGTSFAVGSGSNANYDGDVVLTDTGKIILDIYASGSNEFFAINGLDSGSVFTVNTGTIELRPQAGYVPQVNDMFDLWNLGTNANPTLNLGDGSNIVLPGYTLDTSAFATTGVVTVAVPEPTSLALLGLGGLMVLARRRKA